MFRMNHGRMGNDQVFDGGTRELWTDLTQYLNSYKKQYVRAKRDPSVWRVFHKSLCSRSTLLQKHVVPLWISGGGEQSCFKTSSLLDKKAKAATVTRRGEEFSKMSTPVSQRLNHYMWHWVFKSNSWTFIILLLYYYIILNYISMQ